MAKLVSASARRPRAVQVQMREPNCERLARHARTCRDQARAYAQRVNESRSVLDLLVWGHFAYEAASFRAKTIRCPENPDDPPTACVLPEPNVDAERGDVGSVWRFLDHELGIAGGIDADTPGLWDMTMCAVGITRHANRDDLKRPFREFKEELRRHDEERRRNGGIPLLDWLLTQLHEHFPTVAAELPTRVPMSAAHLIRAFRELNEVDREMRIDRTRTGDREMIQLAAWLSPQSRRRFLALATDAATRFDRGGVGNPETRWLRTVLTVASELIEPHSSLAEVKDEGQVEFVAETIPRAADASVLAIQRCCDKEMAPMMPPAQSPSDTFDLMVTTAAELLCSAVSDLKFATAKTRVSRAATAGDIRNNGRKGAARRLKRDSFSTWLLKQQEAEIAASASWAAGMS